MNKPNEDQIKDACGFFESLDLEKLEKAETTLDGLLTHASESFSADDQEGLTILQLLVEDLLKTKRHNFG